jgi:hypothetical protein
VILVIWEMKQRSGALKFSIAFPFADGQSMGLLSGAALAARWSRMFRLTGNADKTRIYCGIKRCNHAAHFKPN